MIHLRIALGSSKLPFTLRASSYSIGLVLMSQSTLRSLKSETEPSFHQALWHSLLSDFDQATGANNPSVFALAVPDSRFVKLC